ncbi:DUF5999 family protein [Streptomyces sp. NPDC059564]|uniref:DUF5999 family protein n=1 Tax=Streptomyces sp. NPDC059564 TaxID=3346865 RepID=UPI0036B11613
MNLRALTATRRTPARRPAALRSAVVTALETCKLLSAEDSSVVKSDQDVRDLRLRLRRHLKQLGSVAGARPVRPRLSGLVETARRSAAQAPPAELGEAQAYLRQLAEEVKAVLAEMGQCGLVCVHPQECPPAHAPDQAAAHVRTVFPEIGCRRLCNGVLLFDDTGVLAPDGRVYPPCRTGQAGPR